MTEYVIKSTISLTILYSLYFLLLRNIKAFEFNRFYLLFALVFSFTVPLVHINTNLNLTVNQNISDYSYTINNINIQGATENEQTHVFFNFSMFLTLLYLSITTILLIRFVYNINQIIGTIKKSKLITNTFPRIVLSTNKTLPYSFLNYIIVNKAEYENGKIESGLILHEQAHCQQNHSIDILLIEIIKLFFWFNPIIWIIKKDIQLNHEYLADNKVLKTQNLKIYQNILLNLVFRNNSTYLASNFNYSLTKKRLIMMTKINSSFKLMVRKIAVIPLILILAVAMSFGQQDISKDSIVNYENEWWYPILKKHNIELKAFNNFENIFEMGSTNSINNGVVTLTDALFIIKRSENNYSILKSPNAKHNLENKTLTGDMGTLETYSFDLKDLNPSEQLKYMGLDIQLGEEFDTWIMDKNTGFIKAVK